MTDALHAIAWEWVNIALEIAAVSWIRLPRFPLAVAAANLATHPLFMVAVGRWGRSPALVLPLEAAIALAEWGILATIYRRRASPWTMLAASIAMNASSYGTGVLMQWASA